MKNIILFFILLTTITFSQGTEFNMQIYYVAAVMIATLLAVVYYFISKYVDSPQISAKAKNEFWAIISTVIMGAIIYILISGTFTGAQLNAVLVGGETTADFNTIVEGAVHAQFTQVQTAYREFYKGYYAIAKLTGFSYTATAGFPSLVTGFTSQVPNIGLTPILGQYSQAFGTLGQSMLFLISERIIIKFSLFAVPKYFLPLGLLLRVFAPTRKLGSTIIAVSIALFFVLPFATVLTGELYKAIPFSNTQTAIQEMNNKILSVMPLNAQPIGSVGRAFVCSPVMGVIAGLGLNGFVWTSCLITCGITAIFGPAFAACFSGCIASNIFPALYLILMPGAQVLMSLGVGGVMGGPFDLTGAEVETIVEALTQYILPAISYQWLFSVLLPIINYIITIGAIRSLSTVIGGDVQLYGLTKVL